MKKDIQVPQNKKEALDRLNMLKSELQQLKLRKMGKELDFDKIAMWESKVEECQLVYNKLKDGV